jgi:hypothetical protein
VQPNRETARLLSARIHDNRSKTCPRPTLKIRLQALSLYIRLGIRGRVSASSTGTQQPLQIQPHEQGGHDTKSSMNSSNPPPWLVPFDEVGFRSKWLKCQYDADELHNLILTYFDIWVKDLRPETEWAGCEAALKRAFNFGQSKVPEYKAKGCDDAVRVFKQADSKTIN